MQALRDNPELIGTSVGMLRRAASSLLYMAKLPACHHKFNRYQQRLLHFTMSHLMDSRVAATIAETLYELQKGGELVISNSTATKSGADISSRSTKNPSLATEPSIAASTSKPVDENEHSRESSRNEDTEKAVGEAAEATSTKGNESEAATPAESATEATSAVSSDEAAVGDST